MGRKNSNRKTRRPQASKRGPIAPAPTPDPNVYS